MGLKFCLFKVVKDLASYNRFIKKILIMVVSCIGRSSLQSLAGRGSRRPLVGFDESIRFRNASIDIGLKWVRASTCSVLGMEEDSVFMVICLGLVCLLSMIA